jgi:hypothetical protein
MGGALGTRGTGFGGVALPTRGIEGFGFIREYGTVQGIIVIIFPQNFSDKPNILNSFKSFVLKTENIVKVKSEDFIVIACKEPKESCPNV